MCAVRDQYSRFGRLLFCEFCLSYFGYQCELDRHSRRCTLRHPPGSEIYRSEEQNVRLSVFEVDGAKEVTLIRPSSLDVIANVDVGYLLPEHMPDCEVVPGPQNVAIRYGGVLVLYRLRGRRYRLSHNRILQQGEGARTREQPGVYPDFTVSSAERYALASLVW